ncbi:MAG TPA: C25 family cysteine peptidase [Ignavibacteriales bacterium]|nr:C25 family cysteine peptidase [Ignavibacteriales bacterium]
MKSKAIIYILILLFATYKTNTAQNCCDYLIVTPDIFLQNSLWSSDLVNLQISRGFHPVVVSVTSNTTNDEIRSIITNYYNTSNLGLKYVLLIGNGKNNNVTAPSLNIYYQYEQHGTVNTVAAYESGTYIPFYSVHCNTYWNPNGVDVATDDPYVSGLTSRGPVYIGRIPASSSQEISNYVNKLRIYYQNKNLSAPYGDRELMLNLDVTFPSNLCTGSLVQSINSTLTGSHVPGNLSLTQLKVSEHYNGFNDYSDGSAFGYSPDRELLFENNVNSGVSIISLLSTMGGPVNFGGWYWSDKSTFNFNNNNTSLPFLIAPNCEQGAVNHPTDESVLRRLMVLQNGGIIGAIAPTENSEQHANGYVLNRFHDLIFQDKSLTYGQINSVLKNELKTNYKDFEYFYNSLALFGDPSMVPSVYKHRSSNITSSTAWNGNIIVDGNITVASGVELYIEPGTNILFNNNSSLIVNGYLSAEGVTFDFGQINNTFYNGIQISGSNGYAYINNSTIKNASRGIKIVYPANVLFANSTITSCDVGFYNDRALAEIYNSNITSNVSGFYSVNTNATGVTPIIERSTFYNNSTGIYLSASSPRINWNTFSHSGYGIYCMSNSSPSFGNADESGNCSFSDNTYAMMVRYSSNPVLGAVDCVNSGGYNMFLRSLAGHIWADYSCVVEARSNYWNELKITGVNVHYDPYFLVDATGYPMGSLAQSPMSQSPEEKLYNVDLGNASSNSVNMDAAKENNNSQVNTDPQFKEKWPLKTKTSFLKNLVLLKKYDSAIKIGKELVKGYPDSTLSVYALDLLWQSGRTSADRYKDFDGFLKEMTAKSEKKYLHGKAELILALCDSINRIDALDKVAERYKGDKLLTEEILMDKFSSLLSRPEDREKASSVLGEVDARFPDSQASGIAHLLFDGKTDNFNGSLLGKESSERKDNAEATNSLETVKEYDLLGNYPNPFNPETVIRYALPEESKVELKIYNLMGELVRTFTFSSQSSGYRNITWNGQDEGGNKVSSGIYIYRLDATSNVHPERMFTKSAKMMMLK